MLSAPGVSQFNSAVIGTDFEPRDPNRIPIRDVLTKFVTFGQSASFVIIDNWQAYVYPDPRSGRKPNPLGSMRLPG
jgi:hypothetical protein